MEFQTRMFAIPNIGLSMFVSHELDHFVEELVENRNIRRQIFLVIERKSPLEFEKENSELSRREGILR